ncbi:MAG: hypothetical protein DRP63_05220 [Planctomycetota bacterium]|nr:MAG: hypothetical protein DRP63_05220 [Planctomycetota bacterium]
MRYMDEPREWDERVPPENTFATLALVLGIVSIFTLLPAIPAVILGILGLRHAAKHPTRPGQGFSLAGLILGIIGSVFLAVTLFFFLSVWLPFFSAAMRIATAEQKIRPIINSLEMERTQNTPLPGTLKDFLKEPSSDAHFEDDTLVLPGIRAKLFTSADRNSYVLVVIRHITNGEGGWFSSLLKAIPNLQVVHNGDTCEVSLQVLKMPSSYREALKLFETAKKLARHNRD